MGMFKEVEGEVAVIVKNGVYRQCPLYVRNGYFYAKDGGGFVRLYHDGSTTVSKCRLDEISYDGELRRDALGRLCDGTVAGAKLLEGDNKTKLLGVLE
ncbi:hypothetical protein IQ03_02450 [Gemmobacter caeni]|uniref:Uncharacterized protein n=1 Tax=Gemmobacter caeni TaxID=589035 RepID=A0A2T6AZ37_9RHOB|nr:hypothetical protein [Gemmobacter caeni]PTX49075.1 hypothetical protein C8N34_108185 [Gemmobacter caeni]TWI98924.1 hypothetical protein IQ03_02450 [Gemmobacter caeni]